MDVKMCWSLYMVVAVYFWFGKWGGGGGNHVHNMFGLRNLLFFIVCLIYCSCVACEECKRTRITLFWSLSGLGMHGCLRISGCKLRFSIFLDLYEKMHAHLWSEKFASKLPTCPRGRSKIMKCFCFFLSDHVRYFKLCTMVTSIGIYTLIPVWWPWPNFKVRGSSKKGGTCKFCSHIWFLCGFRSTPYMAIRRIDQRCAKCFSLPFPVLKANHYYHVPRKFASLLSAVSEFQKGLSEYSPPGIYYCGGL